MYTLSPPHTSSKSHITISLLILQVAFSAILIGYTLGSLLRDKNPRAAGHSFLLLLCTASLLLVILQCSVQTNYPTKVAKERIADNTQTKDKASTKTNTSLVGKANQPSVCEMSWDNLDIDLINSISFDNTKSPNFLTPTQGAQHGYDTYVMERFLRDANESLIAGRYPPLSDTAEIEYAPTELSTHTHKQLLCNSPVPGKLIHSIAYLPREVDKRSLWSSVVVEQCGITRGSGSL